ncbi:MAG: hypothetical protein C4576_01360 [Desulfobacteraceae bacterium]|nr:MAG: hypothetical protein C4576_01360 [Desulfobacteraceae bacterium]
MMYITVFAEYNRQDDFRRNLLAPLICSKMGQMYCFVAEEYSEERSQLSVVSRHGAGQHESMISARVQLSFPTYYGPLTTDH